MKKKIRYPADFPMDLYLVANDRTKRFVDKWVRVLGCLYDCRGSNNFHLYIALWNDENPDDRITISSLYRNRRRLNMYGWKAFFNPRAKA